MLVYPCQLINLYSNGLYSMPTSTPLDYMIKARYLNIISPNSDIVVYTMNVLKRIQYAWYTNNLKANLNLTQFVVTFADAQLYTSKYQGAIQRFYYFLTVAGKNVNDDLSTTFYTEPNLNSFNQNCHPDCQVNS